MKKNKFDTEVKSMINKEDIKIPDSVHERIEETLKSLPEKRTNNLTIKRYQTNEILRTAKTVLATAASFAIMTVVIFPNLSKTYAAAVEDIPVIGEIVQIVTIRNHLDINETNHIDTEIPTINDPNNPKASDLINEDINSLTGEIIGRFSDELLKDETSHYGSLHIDYQILTNTEKWFSLKVMVNETSADSNSYMRIYHIDRQKGQYVTFKDIFSAEKFADIEKIIINKIKTQLNEDENVTYWIEDDFVEIESFIKENSNFYFNENNDLVIVYNKFEIAPGSMGCPEIVLTQNEYENFLID